MKDHAKMRSEDKDEVEIGDLVLCEKVVEDIKVSQFNYLLIRL